MEHGDGVLMRRVREGDETAFAEIVDRYKHPLVNYLTHLVRSRDRAEELAQDAFVRLYQSVSRYRDEEKLGPYLYRIATNLVISDARRAKRWNLLMPRLQASTRSSVAAPDAGLLTNEIQRRVSEALESLPVKYRAPLVLCEIEEWSYEAIAQALDCRIGTVKSRIFRGRDLLRRRLAPWWTGEPNERHPDQRPAARPSARERVASIHL